MNNIDSKKVLVIGFENEQYDGVVASGFLAITGTHWDPEKGPKLEQFKKRGKVEQVIKGIYRFDLKVDTVIMVWSNKAKKNLPLQVVVLDK